MPKKEDSKGIETNKTKHWNKLINFGKVKSRKRKNSKISILNSSKKKFQQLWNKNSEK